MQMESWMSEESKTITRSGIIEVAHEETGLPRNDCSDVIEGILQMLTSSLVEGRAVKIASFGTFDTRDKAARMGRNPMTGEEALIPDRRVPSFKASNVLKDRVNEGHAK